MRFAKVFKRYLAATKSVEIKILTVLQNLDSALQINLIFIVAARLAGVFQTTFYSKNIVKSTYFAIYITLNVVK